MSEGPCRQTRAQGVKCSGLDGDGVYAHAEEESVLRSMLSLLHSTLTSLQPSANATGVRAWFRYVYDGPWISEQAEQAWIHHIE